jgi:hypothetical protein
LPFPRSDALAPRRQRSLSTRSLRSTCRALFNPFQALAERPIIRFQSRQWADPPAASCRCYIHPPARRRYQIPIAPAAPPVPNFPRLRALALFGRRPPQGVEGFVMPASKNLHNKRHHGFQNWNTLSQSALRISLAHGDRIADFEEHQVRAETVLAPNSRLAVFRSSNLFAMVQARFRSSAGEIPAS